MGKKRITGFFEWYLANPSISSQEEGGPKALVERVHAGQLLVPPLTLPIPSQSCSPIRVKTNR
jgi:hypothetical protein